VDRIQDIGLAPAVRAYEAVHLPLKVERPGLVVFEVSKVDGSEKQSVPKVLKRRHFDAPLIDIAPRLNGYGQASFSTVEPHSQGYQPGSGWPCFSTSGTFARAPQTKSPPKFFD
jgi:hypothetical protein